MEAPPARVENSTIFLWSSPYAVWPYKALEVDVYQRIEVAINSSCNLGLPPYVGPGRHILELGVPQRYSGNCTIELSYGPYRQVLYAVVKPIDWVPGAPIRLVLAVNGTGWHYIELGSDGVLYDWMMPVARIPMAGCVVVYGGSPLFVAPLGYMALNPGYAEPLYVPSGSGSPRYGFLAYLNGTAKIYVYPLPCSGRPPAAPPAAIGLSNLSGLTIMSFGFPKLNQFVVERPAFTPRYNVSSPLVSASVFNFTAPDYSGVLAALASPTGAWAMAFAGYFSGAVAISTTYQAYFAVGSSQPREVGAAGPAGYEAWLYEANGTEYWVFSPYKPLDTSLALLPVSWTEPIYVVASKTPWRPLEVLGEAVERLPSP
ncbi:MAG: hypothetical protein TU35_001990 [Thermoproteus sp. AZ2]|uniref:Uncharacterized protein n=1 Tax=Thermoproteus sp. AZ2 TaxID=1609232 RepID=A0ACC6UZB9_9CREN